ncbi:MAG: DUF2059 domain-containing protein [Polyangia bacterium]
MVARGLAGLLPQAQRRLKTAALAGALALVPSVAGTARADKPAPSPNGSAAAAAAPAPTIDPQKRADLLRLMQVTGATRMGMQLFDQVLASFKNVVPGAKESFWTEFRKEVNVDELTERLLPIYDRHLSPSEVKELIRFYESPLGKKVLASMPAITAESMQAGQAWGMDLALRAKKKIDAQKQLDAQRAAEAPRPGSR